MGNIVKKKVRRAASLVSEVIGRNKAGSPAISSMEGRLIISAGSYAEVHDSIIELTRERRVAIVERDRLSEGVLGMHRQWMAVAGLEVPEIRAADFVTRVPADVATAASGLLDMIEGHEAATGPLEFGEPMRAELHAGIAALREAIATADRISVELSRARLQLRALMERFVDELDALRVAIADRSGTRDPDYRRLNVRRGKRGEPVEEGDAADDPPAAEAEAEKEGEQAAE